MDKKSLLGYSIGSPYRGKPSITIKTPQGLIDMSNTDIPLYAEDETGYGKVLMPFSGMHKFRGKRVKEIPMAQEGGFTVQDIAGFLFDDDEEEVKPVKKGSKTEAGNTAPSEEELEAIRAEKAALEDERRYNMALETSMGEFEDYSKNRTRNPYKGDYSEAAPLDGGSQAQTAFQYYVNKGLKPHVAAGIVGNLMHESQLNPNATGDGGKAKGIAQWHPDRFAKLQDWATKSGRNPYELTTQLDFILEEPGEGQRALNVLQRARNSGEAAVLFSQTYERPGLPAYNKRVGYAKQLAPFDLGGFYLNSIFE